MKVKLLKDWVNGDTTYKPDKYQILEVPDENGKQLCEDGIAEEFIAKAGNVKILKDTTEDDALEQQIKDAIDARLPKKEKGKKPPFAVADTGLEKTGGYDEMWEFAHDIYKAGEGGRNASEKLRSWDKHAKTAGHMEENDSSQGGYLVPEEFRASLLENMIEASIIRGRATVVPMQSNTIKIPSVNDTSHATSTHGGIVLYRPGEAKQKTPSKPTFGQIQLTLNKLIGLIYVSDELLEDSPISMQPLITRMFTEAFAWQEDEDFINGTGAGQPLGILNSPGLVTQTKQSGQAATTIEAANITKMWSRLHPKSHGNAVWIANSDCFDQLARNLNVVVGTGGSASGLLQYNGSGIAGAPFSTILGRPLILTEHCQTLGAEGDLFLCDWRQYLIGQKAGAGAVKFASSMHLKFDYDEMTYRFVMRYDGQPWEASEFTPKHSSNTLGSFVSLAIRE